jgi:hypothetical protein
MGDLGRLQGLIDRLVAARRLAPSLRNLWLTEQGYEGDPHAALIGTWSTGLLREKLQPKTAFWMFRSPIVVRVTSSVSATGWDPSSSPSSRYGGEPAQRRDPRSSRSKHAQTRRHASGPLLPVPATATESSICGSPRGTRCPRVPVQVARLRWCLQTSPSTIATVIPVPS